jgi:hypothetical protein
MAAGLVLRKLLLFAGAAALAATAVGLVAQTSSTTRVAVCIKNNGQVRVLMAPGAACDTSEVRADWVIGGEVTDITLGQGLVGTRTDGRVQLALDPAVLEARGGRIFSGFNDGPGVIPDDLTTIAALDVPAGDYAIFAKLTVENTLSGVGSTRIECRLGAEADFDGAGVVVEDAILPFVGYLDTLNLNVVHHFGDAGAATLACQTFGAAPSARFINLKIIAIQASGLSNVFLGAQ